MFSMMASTIRSQSSMQTLEVVYVIRFCNSSDCSAVTMPSLRRVSWFRAIRFFARSKPDSDPFHRLT